MADIQEITEFVNNDEFTLEIGSSTYGKIEDLYVNIENAENRGITNDGETTWFLGGANNYISFVMIATSFEINALNGFTQKGVAGAYSTSAWKVTTTDAAGTVTTLTCTGYLRTMGIGKGPKGYLILPGFIRITGDTISIAVS